ncbi:MAG: hypothetical protein R3Y63_10255 [Eubacteriales bacterium]
MEKKATVQLTVRVSKETADNIAKLAYQNKISQAELLRSFIDKGMRMEGYLQETDLLTRIIRQELMAIYRPEEVKAMMSQQTDRIAKMLMKMGKIDCGSHFMLIKLLILLWGDSEETMLEMIQDTQELGIAYMQQNDGDINRFLGNTDNLLRLARRIRGGD